MMSDNHRGWVNAFPFGSGAEPVLRFNIVHVESMRKSKDETVPDAEVHQVLDEILDELDVEWGEVMWASRYTDAMRLADRFQQGRAFLVGESTRIHYPASGVGMNFCIQDGFNLGWKLAAVVNGHASPALLDTYESERRPVTEALLRSVEAQCAIQFDFSPGAITFRRMFEEKLMPMPEVNRWLGLELNGLTTTYAAPEGSHPLAGQRRPRPGTALPGRVAQDRRAVARHGIPPDRLHGNRFLCGRQIRRAPVKVVSGVPTLCPPELTGIGALLVRPDGYVAWAQDRSPIPGARRDPAAAQRELQRFLDFAQ